MEETRPTNHQPPTVLAGALDQLTRHKATAPNKSHRVSSPRNTTQLQNKYTQIRQKIDHSNETQVPESRVISSYNPTNTSATLINTTTPGIQCMQDKYEKSEQCSRCLDQESSHQQLCLPPAHLARWSTKVTSQGDQEYLNKTTEIYHGCPLKNNS